MKDNQDLINIVWGNRQMLRQQLANLLMPTETDIVKLMDSIENLVDAAVELHVRNAMLEMLSDQDFFVLLCRAAGNQDDGK